jgi:hypothetical protein
VKGKGKMVCSVELEREKERENPENAKILENPRIK